MSVCVRATEPGVFLSFSVALELGIGQELVDPTLWTCAMKSCAIREGRPAEIFCSIVHFVRAVLFLVVQAAAAEATRVG